MAQKWSQKATVQAAIAGAIVTGVFGIVIALINILGYSIVNSDNSPQDLHVKIDTNIMQGSNGGESNLAENRSDNVHKSFRFANLPHDPELVTILQKKLAYKYKPISGYYEIEIASTCKVLPVFEGSPNYSNRRGNLMIRIKGKVCAQMTGIVISDSGTPGNPKEIAQEILDEKIASAIKQNRSAVATRIIECLRNS